MGEIGVLATAQEAEKKLRALGIPKVLGAGNVYWVDGIGGDDSQEGLTPDKPLLKIDTALGLCINDNNDYIFALDCYQQDTFPIVVDKTRVHIIGLANPYGQYPVMLPTGDTPIFTIGASGIYSEISGFNLSGGATHGCIELTGAVGVWLHQLMFGGANAGGTPQDGILLVTGSTTSEALIEHNFFLGSGNASGKISRDGIQALSTNPMTHTVIRNNVFQGCPGIGVNLGGNAQSAMILDNKFALDANTAGAAITLGAATVGCFIDGNRANFGKTAMGLKPYVDGSVLNTWGINYKAITAILPD